MGLQCYKDALLGTKELKIARFQHQHTLQEQDLL